MSRRLWKLIPMFLLVGCAGLARDCSAGCASSLGSDWIIAQYNYSGEQIHCWKLNDRSVGNEPSSDGIFWTDNNGHLVHIGGWYTRVQVVNGNYESAASNNNIDLKGCR